MSEQDWVTINNPAHLPRTFKKKEPSVEEMLEALAKKDYPYQEDNLCWQWVPGQGLSVYPRHAVAFGEWFPTLREAVEKAYRAEEEE